jgi:hypothetical protein
MLSRLAQSALRRAAVRPVASLARRSFSTADISATPAKTEEHKSVLEEYGTWPLVFFTGAWAISEEALIINEEVYLGVLMLGTYYVMFNAAKEPAFKAIQEYIESEKNVVTKNFEDQRNSIKEQISSASKLVKLSDLVERVAKYRAELAAQALEAKVRKSKALRNKAIQERLSRVAAFEEDLKVKKARLHQKMVEDQLMASFAKKITPEQQAKFNSLLIEHLRTGSQDPLDKVNEFVRSEVGAAKKALAKGIPQEVQDKFKDHVLDLKRQDDFFKNLINRMD